MFKPNLTAVFNIVNKLKSSGAISIAKFLVRKLRAEFISSADFISRFIFCSKCYCALAVSTIIRRLSITLGLRVVGRQVCGNGVFARAILGIVTILVFGIPVVGAAYISRLT